MRDTPNIDAILAIDNTAYKCNFKNRIENKIFYDINVKCFFFDSKLHDELELPYYTIYPINREKDWRRVQWANSDYRFYYVRSHFPNYDYYWQIECDVFCNAKSYTGFLNNFTDNDTDLLGTHFKSINPTEWIETHFLEWAYPEQKLSTIFFPAIRLSARALDFLYNQRLVHKEIFREIPQKNQWVGCETFVATELALNGFTCANIENQRVFLNPVYLNDEVFFMMPDDRIYHPIKRTGKEINGLKLRSRKIFFNALKGFLAETELKKFPQIIDKDFKCLSIPIKADGDINYKIKIIKLSNSPNSVGIFFNLSGQFATNLEDFKNLESLSDFEFHQGEEISFICKIMTEKMENVMYCVAELKKLIDVTFPVINKYLRGVFL